MTMITAAAAIAAAAPAATKPDYNKKHISHEVCFFCSEHDFFTHKAEKRRSQRIYDLIQRAENFLPPFLRLLIRELKNEVTVFVAREVEFTHEKTPSTLT